MSVQNSPNEQNSISKSNQLFKDNSNNKENAFFTKPLNELHIESLKRKINSIIQYQKPYISKLFNEMLAKNPENAKIICEYIIAEQNEFNIKESTKEDKIKRLFQLSRFFNHNKSFFEMTKADILDFLNTLRKPSHLDPNHRSIGTWNGRQMLFLKFFKWLYNPNEPDPKKRETPECMKGIKQLPRKEISAYKPDDMWTNHEHAIFLKYCPNPRDRCYHAMAFDTSCRPSELLSRKISDIKFKISIEGIQYAEITVNGKTGCRTLPLIESIPYVKEWIQSHPTGTNLDSWLFISMSNKNKSICPLTRDGLLKHYKEQYRNQHTVHESISPESELLPQQITKIIQLAKDFNINIIYSEELADPRLSQTLVSEIPNGKILLLLSPIEGINQEEQKKNIGYLDKMYVNLENLREGLKCK